MKTILSITAVAIATAAGLAASPSVPAFAASGMFATASATSTANTSFTGGQVGLSDNEQGTRDPSGYYSDTGYGANYSWGGLVITGACQSGNTTCESDGAPQIWIGLMQRGGGGAPACDAMSTPCWMVGDSEVGQGIDPENVNWGPNSGYVEATDGVSDNGSYHPFEPAGESSAGGGPSVGFATYSGGIDLTLSDPTENLGAGGDGIVGEYPNSYWEGDGQDTFGAITSVTQETVAFNPSGTWTGGDIPSMNWKFTNLDITGSGTDGSWRADSPYTLTTLGEPFNGEQVSGGNAPDGVGADYWGQVEFSEDLGVCLDVKNADYANGTDAVIYSCDNYLEPMDWQMIPLSGAAEGYFELENASGYCLWDPNDNNTNGTDLEIESCGGNGSGHGTLWYFNFAPFIDSSGTDTTGYYELVNYNGKCLEDHDNQSVNNDPVDIWTCNNSQSQKTDGDQSVPADYTAP